MAQSSPPRPHQEVIPRAQLTGNNADGTPVETAAAYQLHLNSLNERSPIRIRMNTLKNENCAPIRIMEAH